MILKKNVKTLGIKPELLLALFIADGVYKTFDVELVVTSITDGKHSRTSRHYLGIAADLRKYYFTPRQVKSVAKEHRKRLGKDYLVLVEKTHIHLAWKPQR